MPDNQPIAGHKPRVLHLLKWLPRGGIETWLTHVFAHSADAPVQHEVLLMQDEIGPYEDKVRAAGIIIHTLPVRSWGRWLVALYRFLRRAGPFAAFHAHVYSVVSAPALAVAAAAGVPVRIIHNHGARTLGADYQKLGHRLREIAGSTIAAAVATRRVAISEVAMRQLAGPRWRDSKNCTILLYGFDYSAFSGAADRARALRHRLNIPDANKIIGHVGRFDSQKNHVFLIETFARLAIDHPHTTLVLIGRGPLQDDVERQVAANGLTDRVIFAGGTDDIPAFMHLFDLFLFPSHSEGLGIVVLEAQAAGCPVLMPDNMPSEVVVIREGVTQLPLAAGAAQWATTAATILDEPPPDHREWLRRVEASTFGMQRCVDDLNTIYQQELAAHS
ncbi:glycosyltransferase [Qipengyuania sp. YIM B01966]|uniref:glycosyltransferase n=1 Tax=Qipengyuania sp. YIM B01966 TaxID=2778646 RepID=UPI0018F5ADB1|nr:glycosyltransferase [Qipengyuania sp. YIM B01966]